MKSGIANLPLHGGKAPRWLFQRMKKLAGSISKIIIDEYGEKEFLNRIADPFWFQAFACVLGYDWHSSGTTTVTTAALKEALSESIVVVGGKGKTALKTPDEIKKLSEKFDFTDKKVEELINVSRMTAKVDNSVVQDGFKLYHHSMFITYKGDWAIVQQGMNNRYARRYHWINKINSFVDEPHTGIASDIRTKTLDLTSKENKKIRNKMIDSVYEVLEMPARHSILPFDIRDKRIFQKIAEVEPKKFEELIGIKGVGEKTLRALALISEVIYGEKISWKDPAKYSFAHGGKDGIPYPVNRRTYDKSIEILEQAVKEHGDRKAIKRLYEFIHRE